MLRFNVSNQRSAVEMNFDSKARSWHILIEESISVLVNQLFWQKN